MERVFTHRLLITELMNRGLVERIKVGNGYNYYYKILIPE